MDKKEILFTNCILYRLKKKWVKRTCKFVLTNPFSDSVTLLVYGAPESHRRWSSGRRSGQSHRFDGLPHHRGQPPELQGRFIVCGHMHGVHMSGQAHVMFVLCTSSVEVLAFDDFDTMKQWSDTLAKFLKDYSQFADLVYADEVSQLKPKLEGRLIINFSHISFIKSPGNYEPKLLMSWKISDVLKYGWRPKKPATASSSAALLSQHHNHLAAGSQPLACLTAASSENSIFVLYVKKQHPTAPGLHQFACGDAAKFNNYLDQLNEQMRGPDLVNSSSPQGASSVTSFCISHSRYNSSYLRQSPATDYIDSAGSSRHFFPPDGSTISRSVPRFARSVSESHQRYREEEDNHYEENIHTQMGPSCQQMEMNESNVSRMCGSTVASRSSPDSPIPELAETGISPIHRHQTTWLERYPYERELSMQQQQQVQVQRTPAFQRQWSEADAPFYSRCVGTASFSAPKRSTGHNYCSVASFRNSPSSPASNAASPNSSIQLQTSHNIEIPPRLMQPLCIDKGQGLASRRFASVSESDCTTPPVSMTSSDCWPVSPSAEALVSSPGNSSSPNYALLEFHHVLDQINHL